MNNELIPFNLERALAGDEVITRKGRKVSQLTLFDIKNSSPLWGVMDGMLFNFTRAGKYFPYGGGSKYDLFMAPKGEENENSND